MKAGRIRFSRHAIERMFSREITPDAVARIIDQGEVIASYPDDKPFPSSLLLGYDEKGPVHLVVAGTTETDTQIVVTVYRPDPILWERDFKTRREP